jgi:tRNA A-37 threonylcarbamoyl transferase component Bud32
MAARIDATRVDGRAGRWRHLGPGVRCRSGDGVTTDEVRALQALLEREPQGGEVVQQSPKRRLVVRTCAAGARPVRLVFKEFRSAGPAARIKDLIRPSPALRAWRALQEAQRRGIRVPRPHALLSDDRRGLGVVVMECLEGPPWKRPHVDLDSALLHDRTGPGRARRLSLIAALAEAVRALHDSGVHHHDLAACNLLVREDGARWEAAFLDLDAATYHRSLRPGQRKRSLGKLDASLRGLFSASDRLRFLRHYAAGDGRLLTRRAISCMLTISRRRLD